MGCSIFRLKNSKVVKIICWSFLWSENGLGLTPLLSGDSPVSLPGEDIIGVIWRHNHCQEGQVCCLQHQPGHGLWVVWAKHHLAGQTYLDKSKWSKLWNLPQFSFADKIPKEGGEEVDVEKAFNGGLADMDVCWNSRGDPCSSKTKYELNQTFVKRWWWPWPGWATWERRGWGRDWPLTIMMSTPGGWPSVMT